MLINETGKFDNRNNLFKQSFSKVKRIFTNGKYVVDKDSFQRRKSTPESLFKSEILNQIYINTDLSELPKYFMETCDTVALICGEINIVEPERNNKSFENNIDSKIGIVLATEIFCIYLQTSPVNTSPIILSLIADVNLSGASFTLKDQIFTIESTINFHFKICEETKIMKWHQVLSKVCHLGDEKKLEKSLSLSDYPSRRASISNIKSKIHSHVKSLRDKCKIPNSIKNISSQSWYCEENFLNSSYIPFDECCVISSPNMSIDNEFYISSNLWAKVSKPHQDPSLNVFSRMLGTLKKDFFHLKGNKREITIEIEKFYLDRPSCLKWSFRINSDSAIIDLKLSSKETYEKWSLAFMKIYKYNETERADAKNLFLHNQTNISTQASTQSLTISNKSEFPTYSSSNTSENESDLAHEQIHINDDGKKEIDNNFDGLVLRKYPIDYAESKIKSNEDYYMCPSCNYICRCEEESNIYISLPVRCHKKAFSKKFKNSCQKFNNLIPRFLDKRKSNPVNKKTDLKKIRSEWNIFSEFEKSEVQVNQRISLKEQYLNRRTTKSYNDLTDKSIRKLEMKNKTAKETNEKKIDYYSDEHIYEEPLSKKNIC